jgi:hypothetical protein
MERIVEVRAPGYETFPVDFFFEVLYPRTLVDEHDLGLFKLPRADEAPQRPGEEGVQQVRQRALGRRSTVKLLILSPTEGQGKARTARIGPSH